MEPSSPVTPRNSHGKESPRMRNVSGRDFVNEKLAGVVNEFRGHTHQAAISNSVRQEKEQQEIHKVSLHIDKLRDMLTQEVTRRTETNKAIVSMFEAHMQTVQDKLEISINHRLETLDATVMDCNARVQKVEEEFAASQESYRRDLEDKSQLVARDIVSLKSSFEAERHERKDRETLIIAKLKELDARTAERLLNERQELDTQVPQLHDDLDLTTGHQTEDKFHEYVLEELAGLKTGLVQESQTREKADDDIVAALSHYTKSVQEAMRVVNQA